MRIRSRQAVTCLVLALCAFTATGTRAEFTVNRNEGVSVVIPEGATPIERDAAQEMKEHLELTVKGCKAAIVTEGSAPAGGPAFYIGKTREAAKLGIKSQSLQPEEYVVRIAGDKVVICGGDKPGIMPMLVASREWGARGTAYGVYDFLERWCGVRWYFPGNDGRVTAERDSLTVPDGQIRRKPYFGFRQLYCPVGNIYNGREMSADLKEMQVTTRDVARWQQRMRFGGKESIPANHSVNHLRWVERFGKTHPEYFALDSHGNRMISDDTLKVEVCYTNPDVLDEYCKLAEDFFSGEKKLIPEYKTADGNYFCMVPNDASPNCYTPECRKACVLNADGMAVDVSDLIFGFAKKMAERIKPKYPNAKISTLAYSSWVNPPSFDLPDNLSVRLCVTGAWLYAIPERRQQEIDMVKAWAGKSKGPITLWNYQCDRITVPAAEPLMAVNPHYMSAYYKAVKPYIYGAFLEGESFQWIAAHLDNYLFMKLMDDPDLDVDRLLDEYFQGLYGPAAAPMKAYFTRCEEIWVKKVLQEPKCTPYEGITNSTRIWNEILTEPVVNEMKGYFAEAERLAQAEPYKTRVAIMKKYMLGTTLKGYDNYRSVMERVRDTKIVARLAKDVKLDGRLDEPFWQKCSKQYLHPFGQNKGSLPGVETSVQVAWDDAYLYVGMECAEPCNKYMVLNIKERDSKDIWKDSSVEVFLVPDEQSADQRYYQTIVNANGVFSDLMWKMTASEMMQKKVLDYGFSLDTKTAAARSDKGYSVEVAIPLAQISPGKVADDTMWRANFCRSRYLAGVPSVGDVSQLYTWTPGLQNFQDKDGFGRLVFYKE